MEEQAANTFVQRLRGEWTEQEQAALEARLERDPAYADAYRRVEESWGELDTYAETPEIIARREKSLVYARRANARRWLTNRSSVRGWRLGMAATGVAALLVTAWQFSPYGYRPGLYHTDIGEQRLVDLEDHSRIALDAKTRLQVRYTQDARLVQLLEGQAQFYVAGDPARPFKVRVGDRTIIALGTVFTVEYVERSVRVAMMEGRVAVLSGKSASAQPRGAATDPVASETKTPERARATAPDFKNSIPATTTTVSTADETPTPAPASRNGQADSSATIELSAGEELRVAWGGHTIVARADIESATAWREGKVIFRGERLDEAVRRLNRYSRLQIQIEGEALAVREISGVFEAGDTQGFVNAVQRYYPVTTQKVGSETVRLRMK
jgi:transmembrane sensor